MSSKSLKGLTIKFGADASDLYDALNGIEKKGRSLSGELGQINKALKLDPSNTELLAQKQKVLADAISNTENKLDTLKAAEKQVQAQFEHGEASEEQVRALRREIIEATSRLERYKNAALEAAGAVSNLGNEANQATNQIDEQGDKTEDTKKATDDLDDSANSLASGGLTALVGVAAAASGSIVALTEGTREYRTEMSKLNTAFQNAEFSTEAATKTYEELQSVVGDTDQAVEAANHLAKLANTEEDLAEWTEILTGVYGTFGASLSIESLAEAANETIRAGTVTGAFADSLNWAAAEGEDFGVKLKEATEENEEWNKAVAEAKTAEDKFNLALQQCTTQQERQQLVTKTLKKLYGESAKQFKATNKEVIEANKATEKWNKTTAEIGKEMEPVITDIKELGVSLLEDFQGPLKKVANFIRSTLIPAIRGISDWCSEHGELIIGVIAGAATAFVAYKIAVFATTVAQSGLTAAIKATTVAQAALTVAQNASPWGLLATAISAVVGGLITYCALAEDTKKEVTYLTKAEKKLVDATLEAADAFAEQTEATKDSMGAIKAEMDNLEDLTDELFDMADASGKVLESDQARAQFIIDELNDALDTEIKMTDGVIQNYQEIKSSIHEVINAKKANALAEAYNEDYLAALKGEADAFSTLTLTQKDYEAQLKITQEAEAKATKAFDEYMWLLENVGKTNPYTLRKSEEHIVLNDAWDVEKGILNEKQTAYDKALLNYEAHHNAIASYEEAQTAILEGNYERAEQILLQKGFSYEQFAGKVDKETGKTLDLLYKEAVDAGIAAARTKDNYEKGIAGYTEEMVNEAEMAYTDALGAFSNAYADAELVGEDLGDGLEAGMEDKRGSLVSKAISLVTGIIGAMREAADSHSPAGKTIEFGQDLGAGAEIGLDKSTKGVKRAATGQAEAILDAYREQEVAAQHALIHVADQQASREVAGQMTAAATNIPMLERILAAIEHGKVIVLDGDAIVGGTVDRMDRALGSRMIMAQRGAR